MASKRIPPPFLSPSNLPTVDVPWGTREALLGVPCFVAATGLAAVLLSLLVDDPIAPAWAVLTATAVLELGLLATAVVLGPYRRGPMALLFGTRRLATLPMFAWGVVAFFGSIAATLVYTQTFGRLSDDLVPPPLPIELDTSELRFLVFCIVVLLGPIVEEIFFRGFLFAGLVRRLGLWSAAILSAAVFGAAHLDVALFGPALLSGIVFALVYWRTGSVWPAILAHTAQNAIAFGLAT